MLRPCRFISFLGQWTIQSLLRTFKSSKTNALKRTLAFEHNLLPQVTEPHRSSKLIDGDRIVYKSSGIAKVRVVRTPPPYYVASARLR